ncbi:prepilin-type N-terminal cleavage/methylation domain-containing protein [Campylobacter sp. RM12642]|uniref:prepilin-type N-terminal cleavage/methylation domain-containing protein n=1 Tax=unclassified Campylobacter TaxID=2593542 RepID=UPI001DDFA548|nr:prepilin-type N-terminal cleavage/methylation domain-containing protein [Campylobacter sp. RM12642]MBZ8006864.1 prepilin-type N-terminal cleavage/methylation domain-containing protein [Campylobacter sp. RM9334]
MKKAFTMIELLVVMVVGAILSAVAVSKIHTSELIDAARSIANDIRYTKILALGDDAYDGTNGYHNKYYRFTIASNKIYKISKTEYNTKGSTPVLAEYAEDFLNPDKRICDFENNENCATRTAILKIKKYNITFTPTTPTTTPASGLTPTDTIIFNELGEPLNFNQNPSGFKIEISKGSDIACIYVEKYSGFVHIDKAACK